VFDDPRSQDLRLALLPVRPIVQSERHDPPWLIAKLVPCFGVVIDEVVIRPKRKRTVKRPYDTELYKERNIIEPLLQQAQTVPPRRHAIRQVPRNFMGFVKLAAIAIWLK
jgi:hypothetical protein